MKVLFISAVLPYPLHSGGQIRVYNLLRLLSKEHDITLFSFIRNGHERDYLKNLPFIRKIRLFYRGRVWQPKYILRSLTSSLPLLLSSYEHEEMKRDIEKELSDFHYDLIHLEPFYVIPSVPENVRCPIVIAEHNIEYNVYESYVNQFPIPFVRPLLRTDVVKIKKEEESAWKRADRIITVSDYDASFIRSVVPGEKATVIPNGVDTTYFSYTQRTFDKDCPKFLFVGNFLWMPNMNAVKQLIQDIWPKIKEKIPQARLTIVGKHLSRKLQKKAHDLHIIYKDFVEDIRHEYSSSDMLLAPMTISGGTKFKMLEAMASGCLVITTKEGIEGIHVKEDEHFIETHAPSDYLFCIQTVLNDPKKFQTMAEKARKRIVDEYDWKSIAQRQSDVWKEVL